MSLDKVSLGGRSHRGHRGRTSDGTTVMVKTGGDAARLAYEFDILRALESVNVLAPSPIALTRIGREPALVVSWIDGIPPTGAAAWRRLGASLARLHSLPPTPTTRVQPNLRISELPDSVRSALGAATTTILTTPMPGSDTVFSHGDAGPENFLDHSDGGALIDFESSCRQPAGSDLGRCLFLIADTAPGEAHNAAVALLEGYGAGVLSPADLFGWAAREGLRIADWRHRHAGRPNVPSWQRATATAALCWSQTGRHEGPEC
ncbi:phosphotransferase [Actinoplanes sp. NPDC020271]|uniref:phosphotransferase n=1 Tax=Actinoplanes sp. NPDC020271 TaxID=3363896 RepID=UPI0037A7E427